MTYNGYYNENEDDENFDDDPYEYNEEIEKCGFERGYYYDPPEDSSYDTSCNIKNVYVEPYLCRKCGKIYHGDECPHCEELTHQYLIDEIELKLEREAIIRELEEEADIDTNLDQLYQNQ